MVVGICGLGFRVGYDCCIGNNQLHVRQEAESAQEADGKEAPFHNFPVFGVYAVR